MVCDGPTPDLGRDNKRLDAITLQRELRSKTREFRARVCRREKQRLKILCPLPLVLLGAGLPILPSLAGDSKSYAERLFDFPDIGPLPEGDAVKPIREPIEAAAESIDANACLEIYRTTLGYPYFLQKWGYQAWNHAAASPITLQVVKEATALVSTRLDKNFFRVRFDRLMPVEKIYLRAMANLGAGPYRTGDVADKLGVKISAQGPVRASLIKKGMVYSTAHGEMDFTVPLFDAFMRRAMPVYPLPQSETALRLPKDS